MASSEEEKRVAYCKEHNVHHLFELLASRLLVERPANPFDYLRELLVNVEKSEKKKAHDPTLIPSVEGSDGKPLRKLTLGTFGINNAGKTTIISALGGCIEMNHVPTVGFSPSRFQMEKFDLCVFDLGGGANFRGIWGHYFHDCHGFMFVVDAAADDAIIQESLDVLRGMTQHKYARGKPLLVLANKKDLKSFRGVEVVPDEFLKEILQEGSLYRVVPSCGIEEDKELEKGVEWLLDVVMKDFDTLEELVQRHTQEVKAEAKRKAEERLAAIRNSA
ncbi:putative ADP ribosylation factor family [Trypanosoma vivax]|uniref:Putative ADP-ribosylation factor-like protein n=1 Tax=Trypanosoma vivax (strain Y486) TaxID=1055687 RepID=G0U6H2_TRYVY|nr:putative ADP ribosylation factor family [Trypanosoma vivax]CCC51476.1 putative ADP-ribosylation factor-like protein [Trypanosoma vivax Y486]